MQARNEKAFGPREKIIIYSFIVSWIIYLLNWTEPK